MQQTPDRQGRQRPRLRPQAGTQRRDRAYNSHRNYRTITGSDTGLNLRGRKQNLGFRGPVRRRNNNFQKLVLGGALLVLLILIFGITSCVRSCVKATDEKNNQNPVDARIAAGVSESLSKELTGELDAADELKQIAASAKDYPDERVVELAALEPAAIHFVAKAKDAEHAAKEFKDSLSQGTYPLLKTYDSRWGYVDFAGSIIGVNGSGPVSLAIAEAGLLGKMDETPDKLAASFADTKNSSDEKLFVKLETMLAKAEKLGMTTKSYEVSAENITAALFADDPTITTSISLDELKEPVAIKSTSKNVALVVLKEGFTSPYPHYALLIPDASKTLRLVDPMSTTATTKLYFVSEIAPQIESFVVLGVKNADQAK